MKAILILLSATASLFLASFFCGVAAIMASAGSHYADTVGYVGLGLSALCFVAMSVVSWRAA